MDRNIGNRRMDIVSQEAVSLARFDVPRLDRLKGNRIVVEMLGSAEQTFSVRRERNILKRRSWLLEGTKSSSRN